MTPWAGASATQAGSGTPEPSVGCVVAAYQAVTTVVASVRSALEQAGVAPRVVVADHGSTDGTSEAIARAFAGEERVRLLRLSRVPGEPRSAIRPLTEATRALRDQGPPTWWFRLDADDVLAHARALAQQLEGVGGQRLVLGRLVFWSPDQGEAWSYGPARASCTREALLAGGAYAAAHHATLVRFDLLEAVWDEGPLFAPLRYGEDLDLTLRLLERAAPADLLVTDHEVVFKRLHGASITELTTARAILQDMHHVFRRHPSMPRCLWLRLAADLLLARAGPRTAGLRDRLGRPARQVSFEARVDVARIHGRLEHLRA